MFKTINLRRAVSSLAITLCTGILAWYFSGGTAEIYPKLAKPPLSPPGAVFGIVWTVLYILMGISLCLVRFAPENNVKAAAVKYFSLQLAANFIWPVLFFSLHKYCFSAVWLVFLLILVAVATVYFYKAVRTAGLLMIPYLLWCVFALYLNIGICILN